MSRWRQYRWPLVAVGLHTALVGCVLLGVLEGIAYGDRDAVEFWGLPICVDLPSGFLTMYLVGPLENVLSEHLHLGEINRQFLTATFVAVVGGIHWFVLTAVIGWQVRRRRARSLDIRATFLPTTRREWMINGIIVAIVLLGLIYVQIQSMRHPRYGRQPDSKPTTRTSASAPVE